MWIKCKCGNILHDNTDAISYKGYIISDREFFDWLDLADEMIESKNPDREELAMTFRRNIGAAGNYIRLKTIFQCPSCGRILLENNQGEFSIFSPENTADKNQFDYKGSGEIKYKP